MKIPKNIMRTYLKYFVPVYRFDSGIPCMIVEGATKGAFGSASLHTHRDRLRDIPRRACNILIGLSFDDVYKSLIRHTEPEPGDFMLVNRYVPELNCKTLTIVQIKKICSRIILGENGERISQNQIILCYRFGKEC